MKVFRARECECSLRRERINRGIGSNEQVAGNDVQKKKEKKMAEGWREQTTKRAEKNGTRKPFYFLLTEWRAPAERYGS